MEQSLERKNDRLRAVCSDVTSFGASPSYRMTPVVGKKDPQYLNLMLEYPPQSSKLGGEFQKSLPHQRPRNIRN